MIQIKKLIAAEIVRTAEKLHPGSGLEANEIADLLAYPPDSSMGDLAFPCFRLSKAMRMSPVKIAEAFVDELKGYEVADAEAVNGYLNFRISPKYLADKVLKDISEKKDKYGSPMCGVGKTVVLDYSSPNVAKPFHIGHLGTTVIGHSLKMLHEFAGYKCIGINYLGDWGTQFGKLICAFRKWGSVKEVEEGGIDKLVELYVRINNAIDEEKKNNISTLADEARAEFHKMETGDAENLRLWKWFIEISLKEYEKTYKQLGITFDSYKGESFYSDKMPAQVQKLRDMGLMKLDNGASIVDLEEYGMPPCLILKSDGSTLYPTRDIAAAVYRKNEYKFDKCIYVTSNQQILHFRQWFKVVEMMGYDWYSQLVHVPYGTVSVNGSKLATRTGNVVLLKDLFDAAITKAKEIMEEKNPELRGRDDIAEAVGVGAVVFYYLSNNRIKDIDFVMDEALSFDGNTGPYVQYTYARACSVLEKAGYDDSFKPAEYVITSEYETALLKTMAMFEERVNMALRDYEPSYITRYILDVAAAFNKFYNNCRILSVEEENVKKTRLVLVAAARQVLGNAFGLICIRKTEKI